MSGARKGGAGEDRPTPDRLRERIVLAFTERARTLGPRSVVMAELASDLGISTRTIYKHFRSKDELVVEVVKRFAGEFEAAQRRRFAQKLPAIDRLRETAVSWVDARMRFSAAFWREVRQHHPDALTVWRERMAPVWARAREALRPELRDDVPPALSTSILMQAIRHAADPDLCDRLGLSRQEAVTHAVELWARGALSTRPRLSVVRGAEDDEPDGTP